MRVTTLLNGMIGLTGLWVKGCRFEGETLIIEIGRRFRLLTCPDCGTRVQGRFQETTRRWRHLGVWGHRTFLEGPVRRLRCPQCAAVRTEAVPWARAGSAFTRVFEDTIGLLAQRLNKSEVATLSGIAWVTVGSIAGRLVGEHLHEDRLDGLRRIGVDEISYRAHHHYLTVVLDHDRERVVWAGEGKSSETLKQFFDELGPERARALELISADLSPAYTKAIEEWAPQARIVYDRFHVARLANNAVDEVRRQQVAQLHPQDRHSVKGSRWALLKRPWNHTREQSVTLAAIAKVNGPLYRAHLLKESFLNIFDADSPAEARVRMREWLSWSSHSRLGPFVKLARTVRRHLGGILEFIASRLTNARLEGMNNKIRLLSHRAFGFHSAAPLIATIYLCCSGIRLPQLQLI